MNTGRQATLFSQSNYESHNKERVPDESPETRLLSSREEDSNLRSLGYEPGELPLLHPATFLWRCRLTAPPIAVPLRRPSAQREPGSLFSMHAEWEPALPDLTSIWPSPPFLLYA